MKTLVCLSGTLCDERIWNQQKELLKDSYKLIYPSISTHKNIKDLAISILNQLPEKFSIMGFSAGSVVSFEILRQAKEKIEKIIILASRADALSKNLSQNLSQNLKMIQSMGINEFFDKILIPKSLSQNSQRNSDLKILLKNMAKKIGVQNFENQIHMLQTRQESLSLFSKIKTPVLIIGGEEDQICPVQHQKNIYKNCLNSEMIILQKTGHYISIENPKEFNKVLIKFLS